MGQLVLLAPSIDAVPEVFRRVHDNASHHQQVLTQLQRMRGGVYLRDGAISQSQLTRDARHVHPVDAPSWHVVSLQPDGRVIGCARYRAHDEDVKAEDLGVWRSPLARHPSWQPWLRMAIQADIDLATARNVGYVEVGGWAIAEEFRFTTQALDIALSTYALARVVGGCMGITTATVRNCSSRILRKIGGRSLEIGGRTLPPYFDPQYNCEMEILRFDSSLPNPRFDTRIDAIANGLVDVPVVCGRALSHVPNLFELEHPAPHRDQAVA